MTPADCKPGTVVMWGDYVGAIESHSVAEATVLLGGMFTPGEYIGVRSDAGHHLVEPAALQLAPRFLVGGEWRADFDPDREELQGNIGWDATDGWYFGAYGFTEYDASPATYAAARQAVERACGMWERP